MQFFEILFFVLLFVFTLRLLVPAICSVLSSRKLVMTGLAILVFMALLEGLRWQLIPAYLAFAFLAFGALKNTPSKLRWRVLAVIPVTGFLFISVLLGLLVPIFELPEPNGPYSIGTLQYSLIDESRIERFEPTRNRELSVHVWYPSVATDEGEFPVRTLWQDLYSGGLDAISFFTGHLRLVETHSKIESPIVSGEKFPVLVFSHGFMAPPEQNTVLFEHLASHGYIIFSIAHTYQSTKVFLSSSEKIQFTTSMPEDLGYNENESRPTTGVKDFSLLSNGNDHSLLDEKLFPLFDRYRVVEYETAKRNLVKEVLEERERYRIGPQATEDTLYNYFYGQMTAMGSIAQTWVEDIQLVVDEILNVDTSVFGFTQALDTERLGIFGHSFGSTAAGEFCKLDNRCKAGIHIDGNQQGYNWNKPLLAPFLVMYSANFYHGNEFAYKSTSHDFWNMTIADIDHLDFTDLGLALRGVQGPGMMGDVNNEEALQIINEVALAFFDHYLKGLPMRTAFLHEYPALTLERREN